MSIYLKAPGANGNVSAQNYQNWVSLLKFSLSGVHQAVEQRTGRMYDRIQGGPNCGLVWLQKLADSSSTFWFASATSQQGIPQVEIHFVTAGDPPFTYLSYTLKNVFVSFFNQEHDRGKNGPIEHLSLGYDSLEMTYTPRSADNVVQSPIRAGFDVAQGVKI